MTEKPPKTGKVDTVAPAVRRLLAPNPSPMTYWGTNTYLLGRDPVYVVDPGPSDPAHLDTIVRAVDGAECKGVLVTHAHRDHSAAAAQIGDLLKSPVLAHGLPEDGRSPVMEKLAAAGLTAGGEGVDRDFAPDGQLREGDILAAGKDKIEVIETPGHFAGHLSFVIGEAILSGDLVMGWASTLISPPDGDLGQFLASCAKLRARGAACLLPGHGPDVKDPTARIDWLTEHRRQRTRAILAELAKGPSGISHLTTRIYQETPNALLPAAERNVFAHLIELETNSQITATPELSPSARFRLA